MIYNHRKVTQ